MCSQFPCLHDTSIIMYILLVLLSFYVHVQGLLSFFVHILHMYDMYDMYKDFYLFMYYYMYFIFLILYKCTATSVMYVYFISLCYVHVALSYFLYMYYNMSVIFLLWSAEPSIPIIAFHG